MTTPELSVLLTSWNTREGTRRCLESLYREVASLSHEVIVVDNASVDGSAEMLAADPRIRLIRNDRNLGFAAAVNQAYRAAAGELILILNSDIVFHENSLTTMVEFLHRNPDAAGVSPLYLNLDGTFQQHYVQLPEYAASLALFTVLHRVPGFRGALWRFQRRGLDHSQPCELSSASCLLLRSRVVGPHQVFDEKFPIYWNDAILTRDLQAAGHRLWMIPSAVVTHSRGASCRLLGPSIQFRHLIGGLVNYLDRTQPAHRVALFRVVMVANQILRAACRRPNTLGWRDLLAALRGDLGPLPDRYAVEHEAAVVEAELQVSSSIHTFAHD
jgi:GT2 family glycosyltransferase